MKLVVHNKRKDGAEPSFGGLSLSFFDLDEDGTVAIDMPRRESIKEEAIVGESTPAPPRPSPAPQPTVGVCGAAEKKSQGPANDQRCADFVVHITPPPSNVAIDWFIDDFLEFGTGTNSINHSDEPGFPGAIEFTVSCLVWIFVVGGVSVVLCYVFIFVGVSITFLVGLDGTDGPFSPTVITGNWSGRSTERGSVRLFH